jgi:hypothetical protein
METMTNATDNAVRPNWTKIEDFRDPANIGPERWECRDMLDTTRVYNAIGSKSPVAGPDGETTGWHIWVNGESHRALCERE